MKMFFLCFSHCGASIFPLFATFDRGSATITSFWPSLRLHSPGSFLFSLLPFHSLNRPFLFRLSCFRNLRDRDHTGQPTCRGERLGEHARVTVCTGLFCASSSSSALIAVAETRRRAFSTAPTTLRTQLHQQH